MKVKSLSRVRLFVTPWTVAHQAPPSMGFSRREYWCGLPFPPPGDLPGSEVGLLAQRLVSWLRGWSPGSEVGLLAQRLVSWLGGWSPGSEVGLLARRLVSCG